ncbi:glutaredoxin family protein [Nocardioides sp.]|uniref:glutaredoxin family protein n=1 Tax=Nocardioides sp. TaxID=35761 RepID=UPI00351924F4
MQERAPRRGLRWRRGRSDRAAAPDSADVEAPDPAPPQTAPGTDGSSRVVLYTRPGCHLCDDAREVVAAVCTELGETFAEVSIDDEPELARRFAHEIPVTFVDGRQHDFWRVDPTRLRRALGG